MEKIRHSADDRLLLDVANFKVRHRDYFHMKNLYIMLHEWLVEEGWVTREDENFPETLYLQRETQKSGNELWIWWRLVKSQTQYYRWIMNIDYHIILMRDAEVMHQGQKFKTNWGEVELIFNAKIEVDYDKSWRNHPFLSYIHPLWMRRIYKKNLSEEKLQLHREAYRLQEAAKTYLKLKTYLPEPETEQFWPAYGLGEPK
jgi:hypothetical protein